MDYKEKLKEALNSDNTDYEVVRWIEQNFPELKESEDERIRKALMQNLKERFGTKGNMGEGLDMPDVIAWLEKQKEFVSADFDDVWETADCNELTAPLEKYSKDAIKEMCHAWYDKGIELERRSWLEKKGEQKPVISDDALREGIIHFGITQYQIDNWLKKYVDIEKQGEQNPAWSKDDEKMLNDAIGAVGIADYYTYDDKQEIKNWLKSLKERVQPQHHWKPNDEQMELLKDAAARYEGLQSLYHDLKKL